MAEFTPYFEKLQDRRWQEKKNSILVRDKYTCQWCKSDTDTSQLHVHHRYYKFQTDPWDYPDSALITLCKICHKEVTGYNSTFDQIVKTFFDPGDLLEAAEVLDWFRKIGLTSPIMVILLTELACDPDTVRELLKTRLSMYEACGSKHFAPLIREWLEKEENAVA